MPAKNRKKTNTTKSAKKNRAVPAARPDTSTPAADAVPDAAPAAQGGDGGPRTEAERQLWAVLSRKKESTSALALAAGIGRSTAARALARWALAGTISRHVEGKGYLEYSLWFRAQDAAPEAAPDQDHDSEPKSELNESSSQAELAFVPEQAAVEEPGVEPDSGQGGAHVTSPDKKERLKPGALHGLVEDFLREHPGDEFGPSKIGKELDRSSGAVNNALEIMAEKGVVVKTCPAPKRFTLAETGD